MNLKNNTFEYNTDRLDLYIIKELNKNNIFKKSSEVISLNKLYNLTNDSTNSISLLYNKEEINTQFIADFKRNHGKIIINGNNIVFNKNNITKQFNEKMNNISDNMKTNIKFILCQSFLATFSDYINTALQFNNIEYIIKFLNKTKKDIQNIKSNVNYAKKILEKNNFKYSDIKYYFSKDDNKTVIYKINLDNKTIEFSYFGKIEDIKNSKVLISFPIKIYIDLEKNNLKMTIENFNTIINKLYLLLNNISIPKNSNININNHNNIDIYKRILLISFNENGKHYDLNDCVPIITKVKIEKPVIIVICTQESLSRVISKIGKEQPHYQHILKLELLKQDYLLLDKYDASSLIPGPLSKIAGYKDTNIRTRVYYNKNIININKIKLNINKEYGLPTKSNENISEIISPKNNFRYNPINNSNSSKILIKEYGIKKSRRSKILFKTRARLPSSIRFRLILEYDNVEYKFIFVNSHIFYKENKNEDINLDFIKLIEEFKLINLWRDGYNVFFCGDLNFGFTKNINKTAIIKEYLQEKTQLLSKNQLYKYLKSLEKNDNFYENLKRSIEKLGIYLTNKYIPGKFEENKKFYENKNKNLTTEIFNKNIQKSISDRILYAIQDNQIIILPKYFDINLFPNKSEHKMILLSILFNINNKTNSERSSSVRSSNFESVSSSVRSSNFESVSSSESLDSFKNALNYEN